MQSIVLKPSDSSEVLAFFDLQPAFKLNFFLGVI